MNEIQLDEVLRNRSHVRLLRVLVRKSHGIPLSGREAARRARISHPTASKALAALAETGLVHVARGVHSDSYELNWEHFLVPPIAEIFAVEATGHDEAITFLTTALRRIPGIDSAFLFGSFATGEAVVRSDIDIAVHCPGADQDRVEIALAGVSDRTYRRFGHHVGYIASTTQRRPTAGAWSLAFSTGMELPIHRKSTAA